MTVETDLSGETAADWQPKARRHGERTGWANKPRSAVQPDDAIVVAPIAPPSTWPRIFPGL